MDKFKFGLVDGTKDLKDQLREVVYDSDYMRSLENDKVRGVNLPWLQSVEFVEAERISDTTARCVYRFPVLHEHLNPTMTLHGGQQAAIFDIATTWVLLLIAKPGMWTMGGTSRSLSVNFLRPAREGEWVRMECEIVQAGKRLSLLKGVMMREKDGAVISTAEHTKYNFEGDLPKA